MLLGRQQMKQYMTGGKLVIYEALRQLPGKQGRRYERKYLRLQARMEFEEALVFCLTIDLT